MDGWLCNKIGLTSLYTLSRQIYDKKYVKSRISKHLKYAQRLSWTEGLFYAIVAVIFENKEQKCKTRSKWVFVALFWMIFHPFYAFMQQKTALLWIKMRFWWAEVDSNHRSRRRQIYSLIHLAALESAHLLNFSWSRWLDSNPQPADYKSAALPIELHRQVHSRLRVTRKFIKNFLVVPWGGIEPPTGRFSVCCSTNWATKAFMATQNGLEPSTSSVTGWRSNQLSYWAIAIGTQTSACI